LRLATLGDMPDGSWAALYECYGTTVNLLLSRFGFAVEILRGVTFYFSAAALLFLVAAVGVITGLSYFFS